MAPSIYIAARRVDGVRLVPMAAPERWSAVLEESPSSRRHFCRPTRSTDGTGGLAAPRGYVVATVLVPYSRVGQMIIQCFKRKRAHF